jgi:hypothetical protein
MRTVINVVNFFRFLFTHGASAAVLQASGKDTRAQFQAIRQRIKTEAQAARNTELGLGRAISTLGEQLSAVEFHRKQLESMDLSE